MEGPTKKNNRGKGVGTHKEIETLNDCTKLCEGNKNCYSFLYHAYDKVCKLKDLVLTGSEPIEEENPNFFTVYKTCREGIFSWEYILNYFDVFLNLSRVFQYYPIC